MAKQKINIIRYCRWANDIIFHFCYNFPRKFSVIFLSKFFMLSFFGSYISAILFSVSIFMLSIHVITSVIIFYVIASIIRFCIRRDG